MTDRLCHGLKVKEFAMPQAIQKTLALATMTQAAVFQLCSPSGHLSILAIQKRACQVGLSDFHLLAWHTGTKPAKTRQPVLTSISLILAKIREMLVNAGDRQLCVNGPNKEFVAK